MRKNLFIQLSLLLITMIGTFNAANGMDNEKQLLLPKEEKEKNDTDQHSQFEVIEPLPLKEDIDQLKFEVIEDGTTEEEDMEKAIKTGKTFFWRVIMTNWNCKNRKLKKPEEIGFKKLKELVEICEHWKMMAIAAKAYVNSWERCRKGQKQEKEAEIGTSSIGTQEKRKMKENENPLECHCMKAKFLLVGQGELQMSSAMPLIKAIKRDLFNYGTGKHLKINVKLENQKHWEMVAFLVENLKNKQLNELINELKIPTTKSVEKFDALMASTNFSINDLNDSDRFDIVSTAFVATNNHCVREITIDKQLTTLSRAINKELANYSYYKKSVEAKNNSSLFKKFSDSYLKLWEFVKELCFDLSRICAFAREYKKKYVDGLPILKGLWYMKTEAKNLLDLTIAKTIGQGNCDIWEERFGQMYWDHILMINDQKMPNSDELQRVPDPCEEAKLKVKKPGTIGG